MSQDSVLGDIRWSRTVGVLFFEGAPQGRSQDSARGGALGRAKRARLTFWSILCGARSALRKISNISVSIS